MDRGRVGFVGHSYGGRMAIWAPAYNRRILASVSNCSCVPYKLSLRRKSAVQAEFCVPALMQHGDVEDLVAMIAPRALVIQAARDDIWSDGAEEILVHGKPYFPDGQLQLKHWEGGHEFTPEMRQSAYAFLDQQLRPLAPGM